MGECIECCGNQGDIAPVSVVGCQWRIMPRHPRLPSSCGDLAARTHTVVTGSDSESDQLEVVPTPIQSSNLIPLDSPLIEVRFSQPIWNNIVPTSQPKLL